MHALLITQDTDAVFTDLQPKVEEAKQESLAFATMESSATPPPEGECPLVCELCVCVCVCVCVYDSFPSPSLLYYNTASCTFLRV